jgi:hypothetical protein
VHGTGVYSARVGPKGPALERFLDIKKKKKKIVYIKNVEGRNLNTQSIQENA